MSDKTDNKSNKLNIELSDEVSSGEYSNLVIINHSASEFILDFISIMPGVPKAKVKSRIILTPQHAKRFYKALGENIKRYEQTFGEIKEQEEHHKIPLNFGPAGEA